MNGLLHRKGVLFFCFFYMRKRQKGASFRKRAAFCSSSFSLIFGVVANSFMRKDPPLRAAADLKMCGGKGEVEGGGKS